MTALFLLGSMASMAWYGAQPPKYTVHQKRAFGLIALGCWLALLVLGNTVF